MAEEELNNLLVFCRTGHEEKLCWISPLKTAFTVSSRMAKKIYTFLWAYEILLLMKDEECFDGGNITLLSRVQMLSTLVLAKRSTKGEISVVLLLDMTMGTGSVGTA